MIATLVRRFDALAADLQSAAQVRRAVTPVDPAADALEYASRQLAGLCARVLEETRFLTVAEFARLQQTSESNVRLWIKRGEIHPLPEKNVRGEWEISREARRIKGKAKRERQAAFLAQVRAAAGGER